MASIFPSARRLGALSSLEPDTTKSFVQAPFWTLPSITSSIGARETVETSFVGYVENAYKANGIVFACILARMSVFQQARFMFQRFRNGRPDQQLYGSQALEILETPWRNGTTSDLLARMEQDGSLAGNFFAAIHNGRLRRLSPDRVTIMAASRSSVVDDPFGLDAEVVGYLYSNPTSTDGLDLLTPEQVVHWAPIPDPVAQWRGMSWLTPVISEIVGDSAASKHKRKFFENGAVPGTVVTYDKNVDPTRLQEFAQAFKEANAGPDNAYKTLHLGGGADLKAYGADLKQIDFKSVQGHGESRIAAASGVGAIIAQFSEGLAGSSLNAGNYSAARRRFGDMTMRPLWGSAASALSNVVNVPRDSRLWYDDRDIPFLQEDRKDAAEIQQARAATIRNLVEAGFKPDTAVAAVDTEDFSLLEHTGNVSVQLQPAGTTSTGANDE